jgi:hypothetical protein
MRSRNEGIEDAPGSRSFQHVALGQPITGHRAPPRLLVERRLGYKQAKYVMRVELVDDLARVGSGKGRY